MFARIRLPRTSTSAVPSWTAVTTPSRPRPPTITRSPTAGCGPGRRGLGRLVDRLEERAAPTRRRAARASLRPRRSSPVVTACAPTPGSRRWSSSSSSGRRSRRRSRGAPGAPARRAPRQPAAERLLALLERLFALAHPRLGGFERFALARGEPLLVLERAHVAIDLRQVLGELRFARAQVLARRGDDRRIRAPAAPRSRAPGCGPASRTSAGRSARTCRRRNRTPRRRRPRSSTRRSSARRSGSSR